MHFPFLATPPGAAALQPECKQRRIPNNICPTRAVSISLPALQLYPGAHLLNTAACTRVPPQTRLWKHSVHLSYLLWSWETLPASPSLPLPSSQEHSWLLIRFYCSLMNSLLGYDSICCGRGKQLLKIQSFLQSILSSLIDVFIKMAVKSVSFVVKNYITIFLRTYWWRKQEVRIKMHWSSTVILIFKFDQFCITNTWY